MKHGRKTSTKPVRVQAVYNSSSNSVSLTLIGKAPFTLSGQIIVNASAPNGITDTSGTALDGNGDGAPGSNAILSVLRKDRGVIK